MGRSLLSSGLVVASTGFAVLGLTGGLLAVAMVPALVLSRPVRVSGTAPG